MTSFKETFSTGYLDQGKPGLSPSQSGQIVSILSAGTFFGALGAAPFADQIGRRLSLILAVGVFTFGVILQVVASAIPLFLAGR
jgi:predicted MFS family arabinose efflux permease